MKNTAIIHLMNKGKLKSYSLSADIDAMEWITENYGMKHFILYKWDEIEYVDLISKLEKFGIFTQNYSNKEDLRHKVDMIGQQYKIIFVYTAVELLINTVFELKAHLWMVNPESPHIFRNKFLQREKIQEHNPELGIKFIKGKLEKLKIKELEEKIWYPFIIKPVDGIQSSGVQKIMKRKDFSDYVHSYSDVHDRLKLRGIDTTEVIVEEFIDGNLYSIDYFVGPNYEIIFSKPVKVLLWVDIGIPDYANIGRIVTKDSEQELKGKRLKTFISSSVRACWIKNTFIHHEFKLNSKGKLKTIELNGRLGGGRLDIIQSAYNANLFEMLINPDFKVGTLKKHSISFNIYATQRGVLQSFNNKLLAKIKRRESVYAIRLVESFLGKEVWLSKDGFVKMGKIDLAHKDYKTLMKDYKFIKQNYRELVFLGNTKSDHSRFHKNLFRIFKNYLQQ